MESAVHVEQEFGLERSTNDLNGEHAPPPAQLRHTRATRSPTCVGVAAHGVLGGWVGGAGGLPSAAAKGAAERDAPSSATQALVFANAELKQEVASLRAVLERTRKAVDTIESARAELLIQSHATSTELAAAQMCMVGLHAQLKRARQLVNASLAQSGDQEALEKSCASARSLLAQLVTSLHAILGKTVPAEWLDAAAGGAVAAALRFPLGRDDVFALERAVRQALEAARVENGRLAAQVAELTRDLAKSGGPRRPRRPHTAGASGEAERRLREDMAALGRREQRAQEQAVHLRLALAAAHAELEAHRQQAHRQGSARDRGLGRGGGDGTREGRSSATPAGWSAGLLGWELVELLPPLQPSLHGQADMPEALVARVRGVPYRLTKLSRKAEVAAALSASLLAESSHASLSLASAVSGARHTAEQHAHSQPSPQQPLRATSATMRRSPLSQPLPTSSVTVLRHVEQIRAATPELQHSHRPKTAPLGGRGGSGPGSDKPTAGGDGELPARAIVASMLRHQRQLLSGELVQLWGD